jgi:fatty-acyl-CoA synthase
MQGLMQDFPLTIPHIFHRAERLFPKKRIATATATGIDRTTYEAFCERTRRLGGALDALGISDDGRVGTFAWNTERHLELYFAAPCTGRILHTLNIRLFPDQLVYVVNHAEDEVIFVDRSLIGPLWPLVEKFGTVRHFIVMDDGTGDVPDDSRIVDYEKLLADSSPSTFEIQDEGKAAAMCYTTGTTGDPKGVVYTHRSTVLHSTVNMMVPHGVSELDTVMPVVPMFHANAWGFPYSGVFAGSNFVFPGPRMQPDALLDLIESERVTHTAGVPTIWLGMLPLLEGRDLSSLRVVTCGGSAVPKTLSEGFREKIGLPILQGWGMTETSPVAAQCHVKSYLRDAGAEELAEIRTYQGLPMPFVEARIVGADDGEELPWDGEAFGELQVRGPYIASDYYDDPSSRERFTDDGWLRTGDVAAIDPEGYIRLVDRTKDLIKSGGEWISSVDLENQIMAHPKVAEAAVIGVSHPKWIERPLACVVAVEGETVTKDEIVDFLSDKVAKWWLPDDIVLVDEIPKTSVGKFSKRDLRERFADHRLSS